MNWDGGVYVMAIYGKIEYLSTGESVAYLSNTKVDSDYFEWNTSMLVCANRNTTIVGDKLYLPENSSGLFREAKSINGLEKVVTTGVKNFKALFSGCTLSSIDISRFDFSSAENLTSLFDSCTELTSIDLTPLRASHASEGNQMFYNCTKLTSIDMRGIDTTKWESLWWMFYKCSNLVSINLTGCNFSNVYDVLFCFRDCPKLRYIYVGEGTDWNRDLHVASMLENTNNVFTGDTALFNWRGIRYESLAQAHTDNAKKGYFTGVPPTGYKFVTLVDVFLKTEGAWNGYNVYIKDGNRWYLCNAKEHAAYWEV